MRIRLAPMKDMKPPFSDPRYEFVDPKVQQHGKIIHSHWSYVQAQPKPPDS